MEINFEYYKNNNIYERKITEDIPKLENIRKNIVHFYDFKPDATVLEIGANVGELTGILCEKNARVVAIEFNKENAEIIANKYEKEEKLEIIVGNLQDIKLDEKFDYITLVGIVEYAQKLFEGNNPVNQLITFCKNLLKPDGKLLIATNNKFALKSYVGDIDECTGITFDSITGYKSSKRTYKLGKKQIESILKEEGFFHYKFFYPLPDYKLPSLIFTDEYLPSSSKINGYFPCYQKNSNVFFSEVDAYDALVKEDKEIFKFFANSYFIEASQEEFNNDVRYVSFNNYRKEEYQLMTKIRDKIVEKTSINSKSKKHLNNMIKIANQIKKSDIEILDSEQDGKIISTFVKTKLASQVVSDNVENLDVILNILNKYKETISKYAVPYNNDMQTVFEKYIPDDIDVELLKKFNYLENGYWDMILKNCMIIEDKCVFFDQEWIEKNVPIEYLLYRSMVNIEKLRSKIEEYDIFEKMGIKEYISIFEKLDCRITENIIDKEMFSFYTRKYNNPIYDNYDLKDENKKLQEEIDKKEAEIVKLNKKINNIFTSNTWKIGRKIYKIRHPFKKDDK